MTFHPSLKLFMVHSGTVFFVSSLLYIHAPLNFKRLLLLELDQLCLLTNFNLRRHKSYNMLQIWSLCSMLARCYILILCTWLIFCLFFACVFTQHINSTQPKLPNQLGVDYACGFFSVNLEVVAPGSGLQQGQLSNRRTGQLCHFSVPLTVGIFWKNVFPHFGSIPLQWSNQKSVKGKP
jgi:hypothetical protein